MMSKTSVIKTQEIIESSLSYMCVYILLTICKIAMNNMHIINSTLSIGRMGKRCSSYFKMLIKEAVIHLLKGICLIPLIAFFIL